MIPLIVVGSIMAYALAAILVFRIVTVMAAEDVTTCQDIGRKGANRCYRHKHEEPATSVKSWDENFEIFGIFGPMFAPITLLIVGMWKLVFPHGRHNLKTRSQKLAEREKAVGERELAALTREATIMADIKRLSKEYGFKLPEGM